MTSTLHTILLVAEDGSSRDEEASALARAGFRVLVTDDAAGALEVLDGGASSVTLVVADLDVEPIGGFNLARAIHRRWSSMPVAVVTGEATRALAIRALTAGVVLLPRPATPENLARAIAKVLAPGGLVMNLAVMSETGTSFVPCGA
jgi:DNA-binding NtrC family response regulator